MARTTRSAVIKQRSNAAVNRSRSAVGIDMPTAAADGAAAEPRTSLHWSDEEEDGGRGASAAAAAAGGGGGGGAKDDTATSPRRRGGGGRGGGLSAAAAAGKGVGGKGSGGGKGGGVDEGEEAEITPYEWGNMALLVLLYAMQGIPLGLTMGTMPFLLQARMSFTQMGIFAISSYPYSFKLFWSPVVDSVYSASFGRRKSWIVPIQLISAALLIASAGWIEARLESGEVYPLTALFFAFVLLAATQDIAVDGWALTLLPPAHIEYASTCQTVGMNTGYFTSFTVFLAITNAEFCNKFIRHPFGFPSSPDPIVTLSGYVAFWGWAFAAVTLAIALLKTETERFACPEGEEEAFLTVAAAGEEESPAAVKAGGSRSRSRRGGDGGGGVESPPPSPVRRRGGGGRQGRAAAALADAETAPLVVVDGANANTTTAAAAAGGGGGAWGEVQAAYAQLWGVARLRPVWALSLLLVTYRLGVLPAEGAASLKLLDKGVAKEALAALVLLQFPVELVSAVVAGRWASTHSPYHPFMAGYFIRLLMAAVLTALAAAFPPNASSFASHGPWFMSLAGIGLVTSFTSTLMFTALGSFFNKISDPAMGGAYLTLLNTIANMGVILPKTPIFWLIDALTVSSCRPKRLTGQSLTGQTLQLPGGLTCPKKPRDLATGPAADACAAAGGACVLDRDGFYVVSYAMVFAGLFVGVFIMRLFPRLTRLPLERWRAAAPGSIKGG